MDSQWLKTQFDLYPNKTKAGLARILGLEPPAISKILKGSRQIKAQEYLLMRRYFGLPVDGERTIKNPPGTYILKTLDRIDGLSEESSQPPKAEWVIPRAIMTQRTQAPPDKIKIFQVQETLMEPDFQRGQHVLVDLSDVNPSPPGVFIVSDGYSYLIRQCEILMESGPLKVRISALDRGFNPQILEFGAFKIVGRVIACLQWL